MKVIKTHILQTIGIWIVWYFIWAFSIWEFYNPFQWIIDIPTYEWTNRFLILAYLFFYSAASILLWKEHYKNKI